MSRLTCEAMIVATDSTAGRPSLTVPFLQAPLLVGLSPTISLIDEADHGGWSL